MVRQPVRTAQAAGLSRFGILCLLTVLLPAGLLAQTINAHRQALLKTKAALLKAIGGFFQEEKGAANILEQAQKSNRAAAAAGDTKNADVTRQAIDYAQKAIAHAQTFRAEEQRRLEAVNRALAWPDSDQPAAVPLLLVGRIFKETREGRVPFDPTAPVRPGDRISVEEGSYLELQLEDGTRVDLGSNTVFVYKSTNHKDSVHELVKGLLHSLHTCTPTLDYACDGNRRYRIAIGIIGVRGTDFTIEVNDSATTVRVFEGWVEVEESRARRSIAIRAREELRLTTDSVLGTPTTFDPHEIKPWWHKAASHHGVDGF